MPRLLPVVPVPALLLALVLTPTARAAVPALPPLFDGAESVGFVDAGASLAVNPAALGVRYPSELAFAWDDVRVGSDRWSAFGSAGGFGFAFEDGAAAERAWTLGLGSGTEGFRSGWVVSWRRAASGDRYTDQRAGVLSRLAPWLSLGAAADHLEEPEVDGARLPRTWTGGLALRPFALARPLAHGLGTRLTLTADVAMLESGTRRDARVRVGGEWEALPGLLVRASAERGGARVGIGLRGARSGYGVSAALDRDGERVGTTHTASVHGGEERTVFASRAERRVAVVRAAGLLGDEDLGGFSIMGPDSRTPSRPLHRALERALEDPLTRGVLLDLRGVGGMAQLEELRPRVARLRAAGKPVVAWLEYGGGRGDLYLASACDRVVASPEASFGALGLRAERRYYRGLLERWGVRMDRSSIGAYKSAYRNFSVDSTPPADREVIERGLDVAQELFVSTVAADRRMERERLLGLLDGRQWPARELAKAGLIDSVGYHEDALALVGTLSGLGRKPRTVRLGATHEVERAWTVPARLAVVVASGAIETGRSGNDLLMGPYMGSETVSAQLERAFKDRRVKAVVFRIESPGGSALASDLIHHTASRLKRETGKPLIVSMGAVAASGGYYIAGPADRILADRFTATGSVGVVYVKPSLEGWYAKHGVRQEAFQRGDAMAGWSLGRDWDAAMQASADSSIATSYRSFVALMARDRGLTEAQLDSVAQGRVWYGEDALQRRLIDGLGGLEQAIAEARIRAGVPAGERIRPLEFRRPRGGLFARLVGNAVRATVERQAHLPESGRALWWEGDAVAW